MAITINDLVERLEAIEDDIRQLNFGHALNRTTNLISLLKCNGVLIHAIATAENKKLESNDS